MTDPRNGRELPKIGNVHGNLPSKDESALTRRSQRGEQDPTFAPLRPNRVSLAEHGNHAAAKRVLAPRVQVDEESYGISSPREPLERRPIALRSCGVYFPQTGAALSSVRTLDGRLVRRFDGNLAVNARDQAARCLASHPTQGQERRGLVGLGRAKSKIPLRVTRRDELDGALAERAGPVEEHDGALLNAAAA